MYFGISKLMASKISRTPVTTTIPPFNRIKLGIIVAIPSMKIKCPNALKINMMDIAILLDSL